MNPQNREVKAQIIENTQESEVLAGMQTALPFLEKLEKHGSIATFSPVVDGQRQDVVTIAPYHSNRNQMFEIRTWEIVRKDKPTVLVSKVQATSDSAPTFRFEEAYNIGDPNEEVRTSASPETIWQSVEILVNATKRNHEQATWERARKPSQRLVDLGHHVLAFLHLQHT